MSTDFSQQFSLNLDHNKYHWTWTRFTKIFHLQNQFESNPSNSPHIQLWNIFYLYKPSTFIPIHYSYSLIYQVKLFVYIIYICSVYKWVYKCVCTIHRDGQATFHSPYIHSGLFRNICVNILWASTCLWWKLKFSIIYLDCNFMYVYVYQIQYLRHSIEIYIFNVMQTSIHNYIIHNSIKRKLSADLYKNVIKYSPLIIICSQHLFLIIYSAVKNKIKPN